jgi:serine/threonine protein phosphatase PrpC
MSSSPADEHTRSLTVVEHVALSDVGREREGNEDAHLELPPLFVVADGMGGAQAGEVASGIVVETFGAAFEKRGLPDGLAAAIERANARIHAMAQEDKALAGMGTTTTAAWVGGRSLLLAHVGDSRAYRLRDGRLEQLTDDHSLVGGLVRLGKLTPAEAEEHPQRSVILRAVGVEPEVEVDSAEHGLEGGDVYLLCSDGLNSMVRDEVIEETLLMCASLAEAAEMLVDLANACGGRDNITAVLFRVAGA